jgi:hypothetical protein
VFGSDAAGGPAATHPRTLVVAEEGARATVAEVFLGRGTSLTNAVTELVLADGAQLEHVRIQAEGHEAFHVGVVHAEEAAGATLSAHAFSLGARIARSELRARLVGGSPTASPGSSTRSRAARRPRATRGSSTGARAASSRGGSGSSPARRRRSRTR